MQVEAETTIAKPAAEVFEYLAHAEWLPEYLTDFAAVQQASEGEPGVGTAYRYQMQRGGEGTFEWTRFQPSSHLAWRGPPVKAGPGSMEPSGWWDLTPHGDSTQVKLVMAPKPGGLFKLLAPFLAAGIRKNNEEALERLKQRLERGSD